MDSNVVSSNDWSPQINNFQTAPPIHNIEGSYSFTLKISGISFQEVQSQRVQASMVRCFSDAFEIHATQVHFFPHFPSINNNLYVLITASLTELSEMQRSRIVLIISSVDAVHSLAELLRNSSSCLLKTEIQEISQHCIKCSNRPSHNEQSKSKQMQSSCQGEMQILTFEEQHDKILAAHKIQTFLNQQTLSKVNKATILGIKLFQANYRRLLSQRTQMYPSGRSTFGLKPYKMSQQQNEHRIEVSKDFLFSEMKQHNMEFIFLGNSSFLQLASPFIMNCEAGAESEEAVTLESPTLNCSKVYHDEHVIEKQPLILLSRKEELMLASTSTVSSIHGLSGANVSEVSDNCETVKDSISISVDFVSGDETTSQMLAMLSNFGELNSNTAHSVLNSIQLNGLNTERSLQPLQHRQHFLTKCVECILSEESPLAPSPSNSDEEKEVSGLTALLKAQDFWVLDKQAEASHLVDNNNTQQKHPVKGSHIRELAGLHSSEPLLCLTSDTDNKCQQSHQVSMSLGKHCFPEGSNPNHDDFGTIIVGEPEQTFSQKTLNSKSLDTFFPAVQEQQCLEMLEPSIPNVMCDTCRDNLVGEACRENLVGEDTNQHSFVIKVDCSTHSKNIFPFAQKMLLSQQKPNNEKNEVSASFLHTYDSHVLNETGRDSFLPEDKYLCIGTLKVAHCASPFGYNVEFLTKMWASSNFLIEDRKEITETGAVDSPFVALFAPRLPSEAGTCSSAISEKEAKIFSSSCFYSNERTNLGVKYVVTGGITNSDMSSECVEHSETNLLRNVVIQCAVKDFDKEDRELCLSTHCSEFPNSDEQCPHMDFWNKQERDEEGKSIFGFPACNFNQTSISSQFQKKNVVGEKSKQTFAVRCFVHCIQDEMFVKTYQSFQKLDEENRQESAQMLSVYSPSNYESGTVITQNQGALMPAVRSVSFTLAQELCCAEGTSDELATACKIGFSPQGELQMPMSTNHFKKAKAPNTKLWKYFRCFGKREDRDEFEKTVSERNVQANGIFLLSPKNETKIHPMQNKSCPENENPATVRTHFELGEDSPNISRLHSAKIHPLL